MRKQTQKGLLGSQRWWLVAGPGRAPHTTLPWLSGRHELRKGQVCCWGFLTGSMESASSLHIPCPPPSPVSGAKPGLYCCPWRSGGLVSSLGSPHNTHTSQKHLQEWTEAVAGRWAWGRESGQHQRKTGLQHLTGGCSEAKPEEWPLRRGLTLSLGRNQPHPGPEPSGEMGASPLPIPGGQCHGVKGPQIQSLVRIYTLPAPARPL